MHLNAHVAGVLEAFVIKTAEPGRVTKLVPEGRAVHLSDDFYLIPLTQAVKAALDDDAEPIPGFLELTPSMVTVAEDLSYLGPVAYCHLEVHGGTGFQAAVAWADGQIHCGPVFTANHPAERQSEAYQVVEGRDRIRDMAIGLGRHRWTEEWIG